MVFFHNPQRTETLWIDGQRLSLNRNSGKIDKFGLIWYKIATLT
jgi:hypothetical protein